jgi:hypothetical protein
MRTKEAIVTALATTIVLALAPAATGQSETVRSPVNTAARSAEPPDQIAAQDLAAQKSMASSAQAMLVPTWIQVLIAAVGIGGVVSSLAFSARGLRQTKEALELQRMSSERQLRAYVGVRSVKILRFEVGQKVAVRITLKNFGQTPAYNVEERLEVRIISNDHIDFEPKLLSQGLVINPGDESASVATSDRILTEGMKSEIEARAGDPSMVVEVRGAVEYDDAFGIRRKLRYGSGHFGPGASTNRIDIQSFVSD